MGIFSKVKIDKECPACKHNIVDWQTKAMWLKYKKYDFFIANGETLELDENMNGEMHTACDEYLGGCGKWIECKIKKGKVVQTIVKNSILD